MMTPERFLTEWDVLRRYDPDIPRVKCVKANLAEDGPKVELYNCRHFWTYKDALDYARSGFGA